MQALLDAITAVPAIPEEACRIFHGRGGLYPGCEHWTLDFYPPVWLLTSFEPVSEEELAAVGAALQVRWQQLAPTGQPLNWLVQHRDETQATNQLMAGSVPEPHHVRENGVLFQVHLARGMNHGLFLDMAEGRRWVAEWAAQHPGGRVLNLFAYTCAFSVVALRAGAAAVENYDMARGPLVTGKRNHELNGLRTGAGFLPHDIFNSWGRITRHGPYDLVIMDPPSYQKGSFIATKDYARLVRRLPDLLAPGGQALLCLNTPKLGPDFLLNLLQTEAPGIEFVERLSNPPVFADIAPERALKVMRVRRVERQAE